MPTTYQLPPASVTDIVQEVMQTYHPTLITYGVRIGVLMAFAAVDEDSGERIGTAIKGYADAPAGAQVKIVSLKDRVTKQYDVEMLIDGDHWPELSFAEQRAMMDHELTHILPKGETDDLGRPLIKLRKEGFIIWGFPEVIRRHGAAAIEARAFKDLMEENGQLLLECLDADAPQSSGKSNRLRKVTKSFVDNMRKAVGAEGSLTITSPDGSGVKITQDDVTPIGANKESV